MLEPLPFFFQGQIKEISAHFNPDLWWFDGDWEHSADEWESQKVSQSRNDRERAKV